MSRTIDERVVEMRFDNKQFEKNVQTSIDSVERLNESLQFKDASKGFNEVDKAARDVDLKPLEKQVDSVQVKFSALQVIATTALANITNSAVNAAKKITSTLTNAVVQGGINRATNIEHAKFQIEGLGRTWEEVYDDINYGVKDTAYGLDVAAKACSQLLASGIEVGEDMKTALRGISGLAAMTNSSYEDMSQIFTTVAGNGRLMSQQLLSISTRGINAAATLGNYLGKSEAEVRDMVSKGQISFDIFAKAMNSAFGEHAKDANKTFTGALSNMKAALARIGADVASKGLENLRDVFNSLRVTFDNIHNSLKPTIEAINKIQTAAAKAFVAFNDLGGVESIFASIGNICKGLLSVLKPIGQAFLEIFPPKTAQQIAGAVTKFEELTSKLVLSDAASEKVKKVFKGIFSIVGTLVSGIKILANALLGLIGPASSVADIFLTVCAALGDWLTGITTAIRETDIFGKALTAVWNVLKSIASKIAELGKYIGETLSSTFSQGDVSTGLGIAGAILLIREAYLKLYGITCKVERWISIAQNGMELTEKIKSAFSALSSSLWSLNRNIKYETLKKLASSVLMLAVALVLISGIDTTKLASSLTAITVLFTDLLASMAILNKMNLFGGKINFFGIEAVMDSMIKISIAVLILASALKKIGSLDWGGVIRGITGVTVCVGLIVGLSKILATDGTKLVKGAGQILVISVALNLMATALKSIAELSWGELLVGMTGLLVVTGALVTTAKIMSTDGEKMTKGAGQMLVMSASLVILAKALKMISSLSWKELAVGLTGIVGSLGILIGALAVMNTIKGDLSGSAYSILIMAVALGILTGALTKLGGMSWDSVVKGLVSLAGALTIMVGALAVMSTISGSIAASAGTILLFAVAISVLVPPLMLLGTMKWSSIIKALISIAGAIAILAGAAAILTGTGIIVAMAALAGVIALFGIGCLAAGAGISALAAGLTALAGMTVASATAIVAALNIILTGLIGLAPAVIGAIASGIKVIVAALINTLVESIPAIVTGVFKLVTSVLSALVQYTPQIVDMLFKFLIGVLEGIARNLPALVQAVVDVLMSLFQGVVNALSTVDWDIFVKGMAGIGLLSAMMVALSAAAILAPAAMLGVIGIVSVLAEIGAISQIPGLTWLIKKGGTLLEAIGTAIGQFIGGLVGGLAKGVTSSLPEIGSDLSSFMEKVGTFIEGVKSVDTSVVKGVKNLVSSILALTGANLIDRWTSVFTGGRGISGFAKELVKFGKAMTDFSDEVSGLDANAVSSATTAGMMLAMMAKTLPKSGGFVSTFIADSDMSTFGRELVPFGRAMSDFSDEVSGIDAASVAAAANAGMMLAMMAKTFPKSGGFASIFTADSDVSTFGRELVKFGYSIIEFSNTVKDRVDEDSVKAAANSGKMMSQMAKTIPEVEGLSSLFGSDSNMSTFGKQLVAFGYSIVNFSNTVKGNVNEEAVESAANAGKLMAEMAKTLPETEGLTSLLGSDSNMSTFGKQLISFGSSIVEFSNTVKGKVDEDAVEAAANSGKAMSEMASTLPESGGFLSAFIADNDISTFGRELVTFGKAIVDFSNTVKNNVDEDAVEAAANSGKAMAAMANEIPPSGGFLSSFVADSDMSTFGKELVKFGSYIVTFSDIVKNKVDEGSVNAAANSGKTMAAMADTLPDSGGFNSIFTADNDMSTFGRELIAFGKAVVTFSNIVTGNIDETSVTSAANAGKIMAELASTLPEFGGFASMFTADNDLSTFGQELVTFGGAILSFSNVVKNAEIDEESVKSAVNAGTLIAEMAKILPESGGFVSTFVADNDISTFGRELTNFGYAIVNFSNAVKGNVDEESAKKAANVGTIIADMAATIPDTDLAGFSKDLKVFGDKFKDFYEKIEGIGTDGIDTSNIDLVAAAGQTLATMAATMVDKTAGLDSAVSAMDGMITTFKKMNGVNAETARSFCSAMTALAESGIDGFITAFTDAHDKAKTAASDFISAVVNKVNTENAPASTSYTSFSNLGGYLVDGFVNGININTYKAEAEAKAMARAAYLAAKEELDVNSPSKKFMTVGGSVVEGFGKGITDSLGVVKNSANILGSTMLEATQSYLGIHSPSIVFNKEVGRWVVQGIAEGIKADMSAEEAAEQKAKNIVEAFKSALGKIDFDSYIAKSDYELWELTDGLKATNDEKHAKKLEYLNGEFNRVNSETIYLYDQYRQMAETLGEENENTREAFKSYKDSLVESAQLAKDINDETTEFIKNQNESFYNSRDLAYDNRNKEYELWLNGEGKDASDAVKDAKKLELLNAERIDLLRKEWKEQDEYINILKDINATQEEIEKEKGEWLDAQLATQQKENEKIEAIKEAQEREIDISKELNSLASDNADLRYQIWEKTEGRDATDAEKDSARLSSLNSQLSANMGLYNIALTAYNDAVKEHGSSSIEAANALNNLLNAELKVANLQSDVLDVQESIADREERFRERQKNAKAEYADYIEKYKDFYLKNGMSLDELEKDAKLVSGFDPNAKSPVSTMISKTNKDLAKLDTNPEYQSALSGITNIGVSCVDALSAGITDSIPTVTETATNIVTECAKAMVTVEKLLEWTHAGVSLVNGFISGVKTQTKHAAEAAAKETFDINSPSRAFAEIGKYAVLGLAQGLNDSTKLASDAAANVGNRTIDNLHNTIKRIVDVINSDIDNQPTIRPVLDLSNVESGTSRLNAMLSTSQAISISNGMNRRKGGEIQNGSGSASSGGDTYQFTQNNYSPKALSSAEIYRQTHNQFSALKNRKMVKA